MRWKVWLSDGSVLSSRDCDWSDVPDRVIALKVWQENAKLLLWNLSHYGRPDTLKAGADIDDAEFERILAEAKAATWE